MCSENEKKPVILMKLLEVDWANFARRSTYEWKMSLAIWAVIAAFIALYLKGECPKIENDARWIVFPAALLVLLVHTAFLVCLKFANGVDQAKALFYEELLNEASGASKDPRIAKIKAAKKKIVWAKGFWAIGCEVFITIILLCCAIYVVR